MTEARHISEFGAFRLLIVREVRRFRRQRGAVVRLILLPAVYISIVFVAPQSLPTSHRSPTFRLTATQRAASTPAGSFLAHNGFRLHVRPLPAQEVRNQHSDIAIVGATGPRLRLMYDSSNDRSKEAAAVAVAKLMDFNLSLAVGALPPSDRSSVLNRVVAPAPEDISSSGPGRGALPLLLLFSVLGFLNSSANNLPIEKDQRTSEALLVLPFSNRSIVGAKFVVSLATAFVSSLVALLVALLGSGLAESHLTFPITGRGLAAVGVALFGLSVLFTSVGTAIGVRAKGVSEATITGSVVSLPIVALASVSLFVSDVPAAAKSMPVLGAVYLIRDALVGRFSIPNGVGVSATTALLSAAALVYAARSLRNETFILRATT